jgi:hypothetical protein
MFDLSLAKRTRALCGHSKTLTGYLPRQPTKVRSRSAVDGYGAEEEATMGDGTVRLSWRWIGIGLSLQGVGTWKMTLDGAVVGEIADQETVEVAVRPGRHRLRLGEGRYMSPERSFDIAQDEVVSFGCYRSRFWPRLLAALAKPDLWISLRRE